jgi:hypothetical protein
LLLLLLLLLLPPPPPLLLLLPLLLLQRGKAGTNRNFKPILNKKPVLLFCQNKDTPNRPVWLAP